MHCSIDQTFVSFPFVLFLRSHSLIELVTHNFHSPYLLISGKMLYFLHASFLAVLALVNTSLAHTVFTEFYINGVSNVRLRSNLPNPSIRIRRS